MPLVPHDYFGEDVAEGYDASSAEMLHPDVLDPTVDVLAELAGPAGTALELAVGTGRVALPLRRRGVRVHGIDLSPAMVRRLREKPGGTDIAVTIGDIATTSVDGTFALAYLVFNTIMNLTTQDEQVACFRNAARHLDPGGYFVVEVMVPRLQSMAPGERYHPFAVSETRLGFDEYDVATQGLVSHHYLIDGPRSRARSIPFRYVWPAELDLMARLAGMRLHERWSDWRRAPFTNSSTSHVSVWQKPAA